MENDRKYRMSVVMTVHDQAEAITQNLPKFLETAQAADCEVIVVDDSSTDETSEVLKRMLAEHDNLYTTFLPKPVRIVSSQQLALSLGIKAARSSRIVLAAISRPPVCQEWLAGLADGEVALVYSSRKKDDLRVRHQHFETLEDARSLICKAERRSGKGHCGRWFKVSHGLYDAVAVSKERAFDAIRYFDQQKRWLSLQALRVQVYWNSLFR